MTLKGKGQPSVVFPTHIADLRFKILIYKKLF